MTPQPSDYTSPVEFSDERIEELRKIYREQYGEEISIADARDMGRRLITLYRLIMQPLPDGSSESASDKNRGQTAPGVS